MTDNLLSTKVGRSSGRRFAALCVAIAAFYMSASAQVVIKVPNIKKPEIKKPAPKNPPPTNPTTTTKPSTTNATTTTPNNPNVIQPTSNGGNVSGAGPSREEVSAFIKDLNEFVRQRARTGPRGSGKALHGLKNIFAATDKAHAGGCSADVAQLRLMLDDGAAFEEIIKAKYPSIENPTWTRDPNSMTGDWRLAVENRNDVIISCLTAKFAAQLESNVKGLEKELTDLKTDRTSEWAGFVLPRDFDDLAGHHAVFLKKYQDAYALVGVTVPDQSVFAPYDAAMRALVDEAKRSAGQWKWYWNNHDAAIEGSIRTRFAKWESRGRIVKLGLMHSEWQVNKASSGLPSGRYKRAYLLYKKPGLEPCVLAAFSYEQTYAGGGQFTDSITTGFVPSVRLQNCN